MAAAGIVSTHAQTMCAATPQRTAERRLVAPTPIMAVLIVWVVLKGMPKREASSMVKAAPVSAAKPWTGSSFVSLRPMVLTILHPPTAVPSPMVRAQRRITQRGIRNSGRTPPSTKANVNVPMNFWPSFVPWLKAMKAAERIWSLPKTFLTVPGLFRWNNR